MKIVTNIDKCRKLCKTPVSSFNDIKMSYIMLPEEIKKYFNIEEILSKPLIVNNNTITPKSITNLCDIIGEIFINKLDISKSLIYEYSKIHNLDKTLTLSILKKSFIIENIQSEVIIDLYSRFKNHCNDIYSLSDLAESISNKDKLYNESIYKILSRYWNKVIIKSHNILSNLKPGKGTIDQIFRVEYYLADNNHYRINLHYPKIFAKLLYNWNKDVNSIKELGDISKIIELKNKLIDGELTVDELYFIEKNFKFETMSKVCNLLDDIKKNKDKDICIQEIFIDLYRIMTIQNVKIRNKMIDIYIENYEKIVNNHEAYHRLIYYLSSYVIPVLSITLQYFIIELVSNTGYEVIGMGDINAKYTTEELIKKKLSHKHIMSINEQLSFIEQSMLGYKNSSSKKFLSVLLKRWKEIPENSHIHNQYEEYINIFIQLYRKEGKVEDTQESQYKRMHLLMQKTQEKFLVKLCSAIIKGANSGKNNGSTSVKFKNILKNIESSNDDFLPFISEAMQLGDADIIKRINGLLKESDPITKNDKSLYYKESESDKSHFNRAMEYNILNLIYNDFEYPFILEHCHLRIKEYKKSKKLNNISNVCNYTTNNVKKDKENSVNKNSLKEIIHGYYITDPIGDYNFYQRLVVDFPYNALYGSYLLEKERERDLKISKGRKYDH